ncbi:hypothetical protein [Christiangramia sabulilitoris]|uniref:Uncharacterized protein n=1 Tax=Christiangramia sabulilitoris TaxID=2583991 RepID=A0A550HZB2_9FLAO|nr:hypothetical protein [Christiangramia sabulilitoris]TRO64074.1 hypothetical protein FGM01_11240 [Christiangramia sabulilitoris]
MQFKSIISQNAFWKSVFWLGLSFLILYNVISMLFEYGGFEFRAFFEERTANGKLIRFIIGQLLAAFLYGFILAFGQFRGKQKKD